MKIISHRGNIDGPNTETENTLVQIDMAIQFSFEVEIDLWNKGNDLFLGHDSPDIMISIEDLIKRKSWLWVHLKAIEAFYLLSHLKFNLFFHQNDDYVITTGQYIWVYPGKPIVTSRSIAVLPEMVPNWDISKASGICTDYPKKFLASYGA